MAYSLASVWAGSSLRAVPRRLEPIGVHPRFQQHGLGRALLLEMLRRFKEQGASRAFVQTDLDRTSARHVYEAVGFQQTHTICARKQPLDPRN
jgi:GNAT superfamily N-acetyltransferase